MPPSDLDRNLPPDTTPPATVAWLGYGGLVPFVLLAAAAGIGGARAPQSHDGLLAHGAHALFAYGAVILSFVGALHWAFAMTLRDLPAHRRNPVFVWSVVPALLAAWALLLSPAPAAALMILGFLVHYRRDVALARMAVLPAWYLPLRLRLTMVACMCLAFGGLAGQGWMATAHARPAFPSEPSPPARPTSPYHEAPAGIGKLYEGREIAQVVSEPQVRREMGRSPLTRERTDERLPLRHLTVFGKALH